MNVPPKFVNSGSLGISGRRVMASGPSGRSTGAHTKFSAIVHQMVADPRVAPLHHANPEPLREQLEENIPVAASREPRARVQCLTGPPFGGSRTGRRRGDPPTLRAIRKSWSRRETKIRTSEDLSSNSGTGRRGAGGSSVVCGTYIPLPERPRTNRVRNPHGAARGKRSRKAPSNDLHEPSLRHARAVSGVVDIHRHN